MMLKNQCKLLVFQYIEVIGFFFSKYQFLVLESLQVLVQKLLFGFHIFCFSFNCLVLNPSFPESFLTVWVSNCILNVVILFVSTNVESLGLSE